MPVLRHGLDYDRANRRRKIFVRSGAHATRVIFLSSGSGAAHFKNGKDSGDNLNTRLYKQHFGHNWKILKSHPKCTRQPWTEEGDALSVKFVVAICLCSVDQRFKRCSIGELGASYFVNWQSVVCGLRSQTHRRCWDLAVRQTVHPTSWVLPGSGRFQIPIPRVWHFKLLIVVPI